MQDLSVELQMASESPKEDMSWTPFTAHNLHHSDPLLLNIKSTLFCPSLCKVSWIFFTFTFYYSSEVTLCLGRYFCW